MSRLSNRTARLRQAPDWRDPDHAWDYVVNHLGHVPGKTLLGEAFPLPKANIKSWPYKWLYPEQKSYKREVWPLRRAMWQMLLAEYQPRFVIAYGGWWNSKRDTFGELDWQPLPGSQVETARTPSGTQVYLAPFFGRGKLQPEDIQAIIEHGKSEFANKGE